MSERWAAASAAAFGLPDTGETSLTGPYFASPTSVRFNGVEAAFQVVSRFKITATVPELAERIRAREPYAGPSSAAVIRAERDAD